MSLRTELNTLLASQSSGNPEEDDKTVSIELRGMADRYGIDPHEMAFIWEVAVSGQLNELRGIDLDRELDGPTDREIHEADRKYRRELQGDSGEADDGQA
jgi:hypothetical protein